MFQHYALSSYALTCALLKAAAAAPAAPAKPAAAAGAAPVLNTLEDRKKFVLKHEVKIDDLQTAVEDEPNRAKKKELENQLKKLRTDETYVRCAKEVQEIEIQNAKDAERAALNAKVDYYYYYYYYNY